jgi:hypothetical protein
VGNEDRSFVGRARAVQARVDEWLKKSPSANIALTAGVTFVVGKLVALPWPIILALAAAVGTGVFVSLYLKKTPRQATSWPLKLSEAYKKALARLTQMTVGVLILAVVYATAGAILTGDDEPPEPRATPPPSTEPPPTAEEPSEDPTEEPEPSPTIQRAAPTSRELEEVELRRPDLRGVIGSPFQVTGLEYVIAEPWDFETIRLCGSTRVRPGVTPAWRDSVLFDGDYDETGASAAATFYSEEDARAWTATVLDNIDRCNVEVGPTHPRIAGEDETWRFRTHVSDYYGRLNIDRIVVRVDNVILQVVVARFEGNNQTVAENVAAKCIQRLVELIRERSS